MRSPSVTRLAACLTSAALVALLSACGTDTPSGADDMAAPVTISAALTGTNVTRLSVQVTGPAIRTPIVASIDVVADVPTATLTMDIPVGGQRTFLVRGYDAEGNLTHEGMATAVVRPTGNAPVEVRIHARTGEMPISLGVGEHVVTIAPAVLPRALPGETYTLRASVVDARSVGVPDAVVTWGSLNPAVASVDANGLVTVRAPGITTLYASYRGIAASSIDLEVRRFHFTDVAVGGNVACAIDDIGAAWCWGRNDQSQLGDGSTTPRDRPTAVAGGLRFHQLVVGLFHTCGITVERDARCWGSGFLGSSGSTTEETAATPQLVAGGIRWESLAIDFLSACGIAVEGGSAYCWGRGVPGNVGLTGEGAAFTVVPTPQPIAVGATAWASISIGLHTSCGLTPGGAAVCSRRATSELPAGSAAGIAWRSLRIGALGHGACGITVGGEARCWGRLLDGLASPTALAGPQPGWEQLAVSDGHACGLRGGGAYCWGDNTQGQLGIGETGAGRDTPSPVAGGHAFTRIAVGRSNSCALRADGALFCWGSDDYGTVGDGTATGGRATPTRVLEPPPIVP